MSIVTALDKWFATISADPGRLMIAHDPAWPSPCEQSSPSAPSGQISWRPFRRQDAQHDFAGLENALGLQIHPDIKAYYGTYWSANVPATAADGDLELLFLWNEADRDRLIENLIGHAVACRYNRTPYAVFFACTEPEDYYLTVNNTSGEVQLEEPGKPPLRTIAPDLATFLGTLTPRTS